MTSQRGGASPKDPSATVLLTVVFGTVLAAVVLWIGGAVSAVVSGYGLPRAAVVSGLRTLRRPGDPARGWGIAMPGPVAYWTTSALVLGATSGVAGLGVWWWRRNPGSRGRDLRDTPGLADRRDIRATASEKALLRRALILRPTLTSPVATDLGYRLGTARGLGVWTSVEDSLVIVGPPRSGKGRHVIIPMLLSAPGAVITTSTRPDNVAATRDVRAKRGPVAVFDPQGLAPALGGATRWSPIRGCDDPQTAMIRARALAAGGNDQVQNRGFWQAQTESALRAFLHAAALDGRGATELYRWSLDPAAAGQAVRILNSCDRAAPGWADALDAIISGDPRTRDNSWAGIRTALSCLADPRVLDAVSPADGNCFDPADFLTGNATLYLLGTATGAGAAANLVAALIEDIVDVARRRAAQSVGTRLDPPVALILDEAANYALPSLPALISEGGGTGITTAAALQSLAQARSRWGEQEGAAIWDAASVKIILGGGSNARDLQDLSVLIGERDDTTKSWTRDASGRRTTTTSNRRIPVLDPAMLRTLPFGSGILLLRAAPPTLIDLPVHEFRGRQDPSERRF